MLKYKNLVRTILNDGVDRPDRTGTGTRSVFGHQIRLDLSEGFPLVTVKRTWWKGAFVEMLWMLRGHTNVAWLHEHGVHIWDQWSVDGDLGPVYGAQWNLAELIHGLRERPYSRRHILTAWNKFDLPDERMSPQDNVAVGRMALAPCHMTAQFYVANGKLSCQVYQRSADVFLGVPFNIAGYALLTHLLAYHLGYDAGDLIWTGGDCHLYHDHMDKARQMLEREPRGLSRLAMDHPRATPLWLVEPSHLCVADYDPHPAIKAEVSV